MKILLAPDKFKGSLSSEQVCAALAEGIHRIAPDVQIESVPMADGGEGTVRILMFHSNGKTRSCAVTGPDGNTISSEFGMSSDGATAAIEMAAASGLGLLLPEKRNPAHTTTVGTGELIRHALDAGARKIIMGIGGSATNDVGCGMASALGARFFTEENEEFVPTGKTLRLIRRIDLTEVDARISSTEIIVLCDVSNPLYGPDGAAIVFAPQKGASPSQVKELDDGLRYFADFVKKNFKVDLNFAGAGAAGGVGAGAKFFLNATLRRGIDFMMDFAHVNERIRESDLVITGEGRADLQSLQGKVISGIARSCREYSTPLWLVAGQNDLDERRLSALGVSNAITLVNGQCTQEEAIKNAYSLLSESMATAFREFNPSRFF